MPKRSPWEITEENYRMDESIYPGRMADYVGGLNDEEKVIL